ncbi:unnamed protein product [Alternaria alternata]
MSALNIKVGQTVKTTGHQEGVVRYVGAIHVSEGTFIGIELPTPDGKNDGSVRGERYFTCAPGHGLFIRDTSIATIISEAKHQPTYTHTTSSFKSKSPNHHSQGVQCGCSKATIREDTTLSKRQSVEISLSITATFFRDEKDRFSGLIQRLQTKCQSQYTEIQEHKEKLKTLQSELEALNKSLQDHEVDLEDALVDKEMAEERADQAEGANRVSAQETRRAEL